MTWLRDAKNFDVYRNLDNAQRRFNRAQRLASEAWAAFEETKDMRELSRWDGYADAAQRQALGVFRAEALIRIANNG